MDMTPEPTNVWVEFAAHPLINEKGEIYHTIPAERCQIALVTRWDGRKELAYVRNSGAWLPPVF